MTLKEATKKIEELETKNKLLEENNEGLTKNCAQLRSQLDSLLAQVNKDIEFVLNATSTFAETILRTFKENK